jgi:hypothetical protein
MAKAKKPKSVKTANYNTFVSFIEQQIADGREMNVPEIAQELKIGMLQAYAWGARYAKAQESKHD